MKQGSDVKRIQGVKDQYLIQMNKIIGKGQYGIVYDCIRENSQDQLCAKILQANGIDNQIYRREFEILQKISNYSKDNQNLVQMIEIIENDALKEYCIIMEKCSNQDLQHRINHKYEFTLEKSVDIIKQIATGYKVLNDLNIIHRDLKPANILIHKDDVVKISDFGMGKIIQNVNDKFPLTKVGTPMYAAPQLYLEETFSSKADIYSLGVIFHHLVYNEFPFKGKTITDLLSFHANCKHMPFQCSAITKLGNDNLKSQIRGLIAEMLMYDEEKRISWSKLFNHKLWTASITTNLLSKLEDSIFIGKNRLVQPFQFQQFKAIRDIQTSNYSKSERLNHLVNVLIAKSNVVSNVIESFTTDLLPTLQYFNLYHYNLLLTCLVAYRYKIIQNAYGFLYNKIQYIANETKKMYDQEALLGALNEYFLDQSYETTQLRCDIKNIAVEAKEMFDEQESQIIQLMNFNKYTADISKFQQLLALSQSTDYNIYSAWFHYFYKKDLQPNLPYIKGNNYTLQYLRLFAFCQIFENLEKQYPLKTYSQHNPAEIVVNYDNDAQKYSRIIESSNKQ